MGRADGMDIGGEGKGETSVVSTLALTFAHEKTQAMVVSRSPAAEPTGDGRLHLDGLPLTLQKTIKILGMEVDRGLRFDCCIKHIASIASHRVSPLRRVA